MLYRLLKELLFKKKGEEITIVDAEKRGLHLDGSEAVLYANDQAVEALVKEGWIEEIKLSREFEIGLHPHNELAYLREKDDKGDFVYYKSRGGKVIKEVISVKEVK